MCYLASHKYRYNLIAIDVCKNILITEPLQDGEAVAMAFRSILAKISGRKPLDYQTAKEKNL